MACPRDVHGDERRECEDFVAFDRVMGGGVAERRCGDGLLLCPPEVLRVPVPGVHCINALGICRHAQVRADEVRLVQSIQPLRDEGRAPAVQRAAFRRHHHILLRRAPMFSSGQDEHEESDFVGHVHRCQLPHRLRLLRWLWHAGLSRLRLRGRRDRHPEHNDDKRRAFLAERGGALLPREGTVDNAAVAGGNHGGALAARSGASSVAVAPRGVVVRGRGCDSAGCSGVCGRGGRLGIALW
mmetsp:Transcript_81135/g.225781  ORF Transcript_81135/g.225781 Transcript_81135/m.225781 type:complete len:241 (+) Transcript_81135:574-1296(+)